MIEEMDYSLHCTIYYSQNHLMYFLYHDFLFNTYEEHIVILSFTPKPSAHDKKVL